MPAMKILMLEDDERLRSVVVRGLHRSGHTVDVAGTLEEARWFLSETRHDVLIFDVMLPDGDGFTLCRELRASGHVELDGYPPRTSERIHTVAD